MVGQDCCVCNRYVLDIYYMSVVGSNIFHTRLSVDDESIRILRNGSVAGAAGWAGAGDVLPEKYPDTRMG